MNISIGDLFDKINNNIKKSTVFYKMLMMFFIISLSIIANIFTELYTHITLPLIIWCTISLIWIMNIIEFYFNLIILNFFYMNNPKSEKTISTDLLTGIPENIDTAFVEVSLISDDPIDIENNNTNPHENITSRIDIIKNSMKTNKKIFYFIFFITFIIIGITQIFAFKNEEIIEYTPLNLCLTFIDMLSIVIVTVIITYQNFIIYKSHIGISEETSKLLRISTTIIQNLELEDSKRLKFMYVIRMYYNMLLTFLISSLSYYYLEGVGTKWAPYLAAQIFSSVIISISTAFTAENIEQSQIVGGTIHTPKIRVKCYSRSNEYKITLILDLFLTIISGTTFLKSVK